MVIVEIAESKNPKLLKNNLGFLSSNYLHKRVQWIFIYSR